MTGIRNVGWLLSYWPTTNRNTGRPESCRPLINVCRLVFWFMLHASYGTCGVVAENALNVTLNHSNYTGSVKTLELPVGSMVTVTVRDIIAPRTNSLKQNGQLGTSPC